MKKGCCVLYVTAFLYEFQEDEYETISWWRTFFSIGQTAPPRGANVCGPCLSPHGALRAYTVFLTAESLRLSLMMLSFTYRTVCF